MHNLLYLSSSLSVWLMNDIFWILNWKRTFATEKSLVPTTGTIGMLALSQSSHLVTFQGWLNWYFICLCWHTSPAVIFGCCLFLFGFQRLDTPSYKQCGFALVCLFVYQCFCLWKFLCVCGKSRATWLQGNHVINRAAKVHVRQRQTTHTYVCILHTRTHSHWNLAK